MSEPITTLFHTPWPEPEDELAIYYALQDAGLPCIVKRVDPETISCEVQGLGRDDTANFMQRVLAEGFVRGWVACHYREPLPPDVSMSVPRFRS